MTKPLTIGELIDKSLRMAAKMYPEKRIDVKLYKEMVEQSKLKDKIVNSFKDYESVVPELQDLVRQRVESSKYKEMIENLDDINDFIKNVVFRRLI